MKPAPVNIKNKRASFDYEFIDTYTAGIVLTGTEIKSIRLGKASLVDTYCYFVRGELWVKNMHIAEYFYGSYNNHVAQRTQTAVEPEGTSQTGGGWEESRFHYRSGAPVHQRKGAGEACRCIGKGKETVRQARVVEREGRPARNGQNV